MARKIISVPASKPIGKVQGNKSEQLLVIFGTSGFSFSIDEVEQRSAMDNANVLASSAYVLQRILTRFRTTLSEIDIYDYQADEFEQAEIGVQFLSGMVSQLLVVAATRGREVREKAVRS